MQKRSLLLQLMGFMLLSTVAYATSSEPAKAVSVHATTISDLTPGIGKVNSIDAENHTIDLTHEAIDTLGWPKMKMEFPVDQSVDLSLFKVGDDVSFTLKTVAEDDYIIVKITKGQ